MDKARTLVVSIWVLAVLVLSPSPSPAFFAEAWVYSNLHWSPDGTKLFYEARYKSAGLGRDQRVAEIRCFDLATSEFGCVVPGAIYVNPAVTPVPIKIEKLYGFELCSAEAGLGPEAYSVAAIRRARDALYIPEDFTGFICQTGYSYEHDGYDVVWEDVRTGTRQVLAEGAYPGAAYLKKSHSLVYTLGDRENSSGRLFPDMYLLNLRTRRKRRLGSFHWLGATADERRATVWRYLGVSRYDNDRAVMSISLAADEAKPKELFKDRFYRYAVSPGGNKLAYVRLPSGPERSLSLRAVDLTTGESADLPKGRFQDHPGGQHWSPDDKYFVFQSFSEKPPGGRVCVVDTDGRKIVGFFNLPYERFFSWSPSAKYVVAFETKAGRGDLRLIDVEAAEEWPVQEDEAAFFCWVGGSRFLYSGGGKLYSYDCEKKEGRVVYAWFSEGHYEVLTWISDSQLIFVHGSKAYMEYGNGNLHLLDVRTGAHRVLAPGNGFDFFFAEDGDLVFRAEGMPRGYPEYWKLDFGTGYAAPYRPPDEAGFRRLSARPAGGVVPSPDGGRVAVLEGGKLTLQDADGSNPVTLMVKGKGDNVGELAEAEPKNAVWSPAGDKVAWLREGDPDGPFTDIWVANRDGSAVHLAVEADTNYNHRIYGKR